MMADSFEQGLDALTAEGELGEPHADGSVTCRACAHRCLIHAGKRGICRVRFNADGRLKVPWGYVAGLQCDPIEKKPFFHVYPGADVVTFGMLGCNLHCEFCQNWTTSQTLRDEAAGSDVMRISPQQVAAFARREGAHLIASSYNEPLITSEWARAIFKEATPLGIKCVYVSNGNVTREVLEYLRPYLMGYKVDLKTMSDRNYRRLGAVLQHVLDGIRLAHEMGFWVEVVTLVVPGFNDSHVELWEAARFLAGVSPDIPWHVTAYHPAYKAARTIQRATPASTLLRAAEIGQEAGLHYVYTGNLPGQTEDYEHTRCPKCNTRLIERDTYVILDYRLTAEGTCPKCGTPIAGRWTDHPETVRLGGPGRPRRL
jgi:pyruvate formate lyase activating enzyme